MLPNYILTDTIEIYSKQGNSAYEELFSNVATSVKVYTEPSFKTMIDNKGVQVISSVLIICKPSVSIAAGDKVVFNSINYEVIAADTFKIIGTSNHKEVYLKVLIS